MGKINAILLQQNAERKNEVVMYATQYIQERYAEKIHIANIAEQLNISTRYLSKLFFEAMNLSILQYINIYRIECAIKLMINTDRTFIDIAIAVGLNDAQHFSKLFHNIIGISPRDYKNLCKGKK